MLDNYYESEEHLVRATIGSRNMKSKRWDKKEPQPTQETERNDRDSFMDCEPGCDYWGD